MKGKKTPTAWSRPHLGEHLSLKVTQICCFLKFIDLPSLCLWCDVLLVVNLLLIITESFSITFAISTPFLGSFKLVTLICVQQVESFFFILNCYIIEHWTCEHSLMRNLWLNDFQEYILSVEAHSLNIDFLFHKPCR